jgi:hypothetical protein
MQQAAKLLKYGVPLDRIEEMDDTERLAWLFACQEAAGHKFNWTVGAWE